MKSVPSLPFLPLAVLFLAAAFVPASAARAARSAATRPAVYKSAIAIDAQTGAVLFQENADAVSPPASMTKLMTYAVLFDQLRSGQLALDTRVTVTPADARVGMFRDSTNVWLKQGERFTVEELIYAMMIQSANDAAYTLAHKAGGNVENFVRLMNAKARELGMTRSLFRSPHGFPPPSRRIADGDLTTARDYSLLCRYLVKHTDVLRYTSVKSRIFGAGVRLNPVQMTNHNHLLGRSPGVDGLKTGFTNGAGFCLAATAQRGGHRLIVVMMDSPDQRTRDLHVQELINREFAALPPNSPTFTSDRGRSVAASEASLAPVGSETPSPESGAAEAAPAETGPVIHFPAPNAE